MPLDHITRTLPLLGATGHGEMRAGEGSRAGIAGR